MMNETWRDASPTQAIRARPEIWAAVRAVHAQWQITEPRLKLAETANRLLIYALEHVREIESVQATVEVHDDDHGQ